MSDPFYRYCTNRPPCGNGNERCTLNPHCEKKKEQTGVVRMVIWIAICTFALFIGLPFAILFFVC